MLFSRLAAWVLAALVVTVPRLASADVGSAAQKQFGSDAKTLENAKVISSLLGPNSHFRAHFGLWYATLGPIPFGGGDASFAAPGVNAGRGLLRDVGIALGVRGNEAFFSYLDDRLLASADDAIDDSIKNNTARRVIKQLVGQFKPNLKDILGEHEVAFRVVYGNVRGTIPNADLFVGHNERLYVPGVPDRTWTSRIFSGEIAVKLGGEKGTTGQSFCSGENSCDYFGYFRYTNFSRPQTLSVSPDSFTPTAARNTLQDVTISAYELGARGAVGFGETVRVTMLVGLGGGYGRVDFGRYGTFAGGILTTDSEFRLSYPIDFGKFGIAPYASFRYLALFPGAQPKPPAATFENKLPAHALVKSDLLGYSLWGPSVGLELIL